MKVPDLSLSHIKRCEPLLGAPSRGGMSLRGGLGPAPLLHACALLYRLLTRGCHCEAGALGAIPQQLRFSMDCATGAFKCAMRHLGANACCPEPLCSVSKVLCKWPGWAQAPKCVLNLICFSLLQSN
jgi:hypothetical protein